MDTHLGGRAACLAETRATTKHRKMTDRRATDRDVAHRHLVRHDTDVAILFSRARLIDRAFASRHIYAHMPPRTLASLAHALGAAPDVGAALVALAEALAELDRGATVALLTY